MAYFCLLLSAALLLFKGCSTEVFSASADLTSTFRLEQQVVNVLGELLSRTESKLEVIRRYLKDYESVVEEKADNEEEFMERVAGNPIHAYRLMKRLYFDWQTIENEIKSDEWKNALKRLENVRMGARFPKEEDFFGAAQALVRLQDTYELNMTQLARGNLWGRQTRAELTAQDCLFMGKHAFNAGAYARAVEWFEESYILAGLENNQTVRQDQVMDFIQHAITMHDDVLRNSRSHYPAGVVSFRLPLKDRPAVVQRDEIIRTRKYTLGKHIGVEDDVNNFNALCRGESLLSQKVVSKLKCWYDDRNQAYFRLMPIQVEQQSFDPVIYTFHNVLSDKEIDALKELAKPLLARSMVQGKVGVGSGHEVSNVRTSKTAWLSESLDPLLPHLSKRISLITGLTTNPFKDEAELLQMANYGIGGHYSPHHDYLMKDMKDFEEKKKFMHHRELSAGDRIGTFMFYLNDVERGGATAFPRAGVAVRPTKGGAAFWYNLKRSGKPDPMTLHGACPVLLGHKWVSNKWIRETAQTFHRPCTLDANE